MNCRVLATSVEIQLLFVSMETIMSYDVIQTMTSHACNDSDLALMAAICSQLLLATGLLNCDGLRFGVAAAHGW